MPWLDQATDDDAGRGDFESAARDLDRIRKAWPGALETLITGHYPMAQFCERAGNGGGMKDVIAVSGA